ncbi:MAG: hypothetical protein ACJAU2_000775 [Maribacter sp.]|jgi:hypothetical protein
MKIYFHKMVASRFYGNLIPIQDDVLISITIVCHKKQVKPANFIGFIPNDF